MHPIAMVLRHGQGELGRSPECLVNDTVVLGELDEGLELVARRGGIEIEAQTNVAKADRRRAAEAERAAKIEIARR